MSVTMLADGEYVDAVVLNRPLGQAFTQSGYAADGSDFGGFVRTVSGRGGAVVLVSADITDATAANTGSRIMLRAADGSVAMGVATVTQLNGPLQRTLSFGSHFSGGTFNNSADRTIAIDATDANTASAIVARDGAGNFAAGTITASLSGTASAASSVPVAGVTGLLSGGKILPSLLPALAITDTFVVASQVAMLALTAETGDVAVRSDLNKSFILRVNDPTVLANWQELLTPTDAVLSVAGRTGAVTLISADITDATSANTANRLVLRDGNGDFAARIITATLVGNASTATALATGRAINGVTFDGTAAITVTAAAGTLTGTTLNATVVTSSLTTLGTIATLSATGATIGTASAPASGYQFRVISTTGDRLRVTSLAAGSGVTLDVTDAAESTTVGHALNINSLLQLNAGMRVINGDHMRLTASGAGAGVVLDSTNAAEDAYALLTLTGETLVLNGNSFAVTVNGGMTVAASVRPTTISNVLNVSPTVAAGTYGAQIVGAAGANRDIVLIGAAGVSNGFTVQVVGGVMIYKFNDLPTSSAGLPSGALWKNASAVNVA